MSKSKNCISIKNCVIELVFDRPLGTFVKAKNLRGAIASANRELVHFHHHTINGSLIYTYPLVQYKVIDGEAYIVGINEGAIELGKIDILNKSLKLGSDKEYVVQEQKIYFVNSNLGLYKEKIKYEFLSPWLALNERNYEEYQKLGSWAKRKILLEKILIGNIISMSKGLGYTVPGPIEANILKSKEVNTFLKANPMLGFLGEFEVNFEIPDYLGIGKSVSRGFGTVKKIR